LSRKAVHRELKTDKESKPMAIHTLPSSSSVIEARITSFSGKNPFQDDHIRRLWFNAVSEMFIAVGGANDQALFCFGLKEKWFRWHYG